MLKIRRVMEKKRGRGKVTFCFTCSILFVFPRKSITHDSDILKPRRMWVCFQKLRVLRALGDNAVVWIGVNKYNYSLRMEPSEIEFLAEDTVVTVVPNFNCRKTYLITGELGPFRAGIPLKVPLWLAADLKRRQKCRIVPPAWMDLEKLEKLRDEEAESPRFCEMPSEYYIVEAKIILGLGIEDNPSLIPIMSVIKDIWDRRMAKLATSVNVFMHLGGDFVRIPNLTPPELNIIRPLLPNAMDFLSRLGGEQENPENAENPDDVGRMRDSEMRSVLNSTNYFSPSWLTSH